LLLPYPDGKIRPNHIEPQLLRLGDQHSVQPRVVFITQPTELGACYTLKELHELKNFCEKHQLLIHMDGARLGSACQFLNEPFKALTQDVGIDALSLGGTKNGLLGAEMVIFWDQARYQDFKFYRKQLMQLPSKSRFLSAQFL